MGYKGDSFMDSGYFFAPYVPVYSTPVITTNSLKKRYNIFKSKDFEPIPEPKIRRKFRSIDDPWETFDE